MARYDMDALVEETLGHLSGHTLDMGQLTWLDSAISDSDLSVDVNDGDNVHRGIVEIGDELVYVASTSGSGMTIAPFGRGFQGTEAQAHAADTRVTYAPRFPRARIKQKINDIILGTWPQLFGVKDIEIDPEAAVMTYELPDDAEQVFTVKQGVVGPDDKYERTLRRWSFNHEDKTLDITDMFTLVRPFHVTYQTKPTEIGSDGEFTDSGLKERAWPCIMYGVLHQLIATQEAGISGLHSVKAAESQTRRQISPAELSREYYAVHQQLLTDERMRLLAETEITNNEEML